MSCGFWEPESRREETAGPGGAKNQPEGLWKFAYKYFCIFMQFAGRIEINKQSKIVCVTVHFLDSEDRENDSLR